MSYCLIISKTRVNVEHIQVNEAAQEFIIETIKNSKVSEVDFENLAQDFF